MSIHHSAIWGLVNRQHGVIARRQLLELGVKANGIQHRLGTGRLHLLMPGVYAVGRPELTQKGRWMAAVLACGPEAVLSHTDAAALWEIRAPPKGGPIHISLPARVAGRRPGIRLHRRHALTAADITRHHGIPVTTPVCTLIDLAADLKRGPLERAINEAHNHGLIHVERLPSILEQMAPRPGLGVLRKTLDRRTFKLLDSGVERRFLPLARRAGLGLPETGVYVNGFKVDFYWRDLGLVVETDSLRYHRTPAQQARDRIRDQAHMAAGMTPLRFTDEQIADEPGYVQTMLAAVARRLRSVR